MRVGENMRGDGINGVLLDTTAVRGEGTASEINGTKSVRINELENMHFVGCIALHTSLYSQATV